MNAFRLSLATFAFGLLLGFSLTSHAAPQKTTKRQNNRAFQKRRIVFEKVDIVGKRHLPSALYVLSRERFSYSIPLRGKENWSRKVIRAVKKKPF